MTFTKKIRKKGKVYAIEVEGYRDEQGNVKHKYVRYLGRLDKNGNLLPSQGDIKVDTVLQFGLPFVVAKSIEEVKLMDALTDYKEEIAALVLSFVVSPSSISKMLRQIHNIDPSLIGIDFPVNRKRIENALDFLEENKEIVEHRLYESMKHRYDNETLFYDITSIVLNGYRSALAKIGYPEFEPQINIGLCIEGGSGFPIFHEVFPGNIAHRKTLVQFIDRLKMFDKEHAIIIVDAGIAGDEEHLHEVPTGLDVIARMPMHPNMKKMALENLTTSFRDMVQLSGAKVYVKEIHKEKGKLLVCYNEKLKVGIKEKRYDEVMTALKRKKKGLQIKDGLKKYLLKDDDGWKINYDEIEDVERYDGIYVLYCSIRDMPKEKIVKAYFGRDRIEKCFSLMKNELEIAPLRFQIDKRIRARIVLCYLAYLVVTNIEVKLTAHEMPQTIETIKEILSNVYKVRICRGNKSLERISSLTEEQKKILGLFGALS